ncbi:hypothetical protein WOLCODRAFT_113329 [Wolfiporia cocos MD-104 SS10]|uniref:Lethal giant larvae (Lgl)-like C-terminal domain-containing protein n=1 Tax=Wolfiporia cocos (strain MD-104) TaxID=742152 RepID=A0A2H3JBZ1_WOLCO|nr:hypothetical protein WOLCODRAFT_113329 [Wolfiporia cocos MD-104 SS10]
MSPYTVPSNLWQLYEEKVQASGMPTLATPVSNMIVDAVIHPRDLNLLFVAYEGGVILSDLKQRNTVRVYELVLPPGAPGGAGYYASDILLPRRPPVTALAVHPSGHVLAVGHADGSIAFWALEDEDRPLIVRTLDSNEDEDVGALDVDKLEAALPNGHAPENHPNAVAEAREPIFKLAWSGFPNSADIRGGDTVLTVLGGLTSNAPPGLTTFLLPPLNPPASPNPTQEELHPDIRTAIRGSLVPLDSHTYSTAGAVQDFLLVPRANPHFSGTWDPQAVLLLSDSDLDATNTIRIVEAYEFPPPAFGSATMTPAELNPASGGTEGDDPHAALTEELASTLRSMSLSADPRPVRLPMAFWGLAGSAIVRLDKSTYAQLVRQEEGKAGIGEDMALPLKGGKAWVEDTEGQMKLMKFQPRRVMITHDHDLNLRFLDLSAQLLITSVDTPMSTAFPNPLHALTIELGPLIHDPSLRLSSPGSSVNNASPSGSQISLEKSATDAGGPRIDSVYLAAESLECVTVMKNGAVIVHRLDAGDAHSPVESTDEELVSLTRIPVRSHLRFRPFFAVKPGCGQVTACAISDIGFLAVGYATGNLLIIDMRGPRVIFRNASSKKENRHSLIGRQSQREPVVALTWAIGPIASDPTPRIRLIAASASGPASIHAISRTTEGAWTVLSPPASSEASARTVPGGSVVLDAKTGARSTADRQALASVLSGEAAALDPTGTRGRKTASVWVSAGYKSVRCVADLDGERIAKADWGSKAGNVLRVEVVEKNNARALVAFTDHSEALVYSLPFLEHLHTLQLPQSGLSRLSSDSSGDYLTHTYDPATGLVRATHYGTVFGTRRTAPYAAPLTDLAHGRGTVPAQPAPVPLEPQGVIGSVLGYLGRGVTPGAEIDALLAGPDRPEPAVSAYDARGRPPPASRDAQAADTGPSAFQQASASMSTGVGDLYNRLGNALAERGEMLGSLEEQFKSLEEGSKGMVAQAQKLAAQQSAKRWFGF